jgi:ABC-type transporter lipoprotein component MlaA
MAAGISTIPVFFNSVDEIKNYVSYVLDSVNDAAELHATRLLIDTIIDAETEEY